MAYSTGTGTDQVDFLNALQTFALGLGWTINRWDTTNKLLYLSNGICKVCFEWLNVNISVYYDSTSSTTFSEGRIRGTLVNTITDTATNYWTFPGSAVVSTTTGRDNGPLAYSCNIQGSFVAWHLYSNATGDYIHAIIEVTAGVYTFIGFGIADNNGLSHSGAAYLFADALRYWYDNSSNIYPPSDATRHYFNKASMTGSMFSTTSGTRSPSCSLQILSSDALPSGFVNNVAIANSGSSTYSSTSSRAMSIRKTEAGSLLSQNNSPAGYIASSSGYEVLGDFLVTASSPDYSTFIPMIGIPLIVTDETLTQACAIGSIPDLRLINLKGLSPQQTISLSGDTWKVFPQLRMADWTTGINELNPSSGFYGFAIKIV